MWVVRDKADVEWEVDTEGVEAFEVTSDGELWFLDRENCALAVFAPGAWAHAWSEDD